MCSRAPDLVADPCFLTSGWQARLEAVCTGVIIWIGNHVILTELSFLHWIVYRACELFVVSHGKQVYGVWSLRCWWVSHCWLMSREAGRDGHRMGSCLLVDSPKSVQWPQAGDLGVPHGYRGPSHLGCQCQFYFPESILAGSWTWEWSWELNPGIAVWDISFHE